MFDRGSPQASIYWIAPQGLPARSPRAAASPAKSVLLSWMGAFLLATAGTSGAVQAEDRQPLQPDGFRAPAFLGALGIRSPQDHRDVPGGSRDQQLPDRRHGFRVQGDRPKDAGDRRELRRRLQSGRSHRLVGRRCLRRELMGRGKCPPSLRIRFPGQLLVDAPGLIELTQNVGFLSG